MRGGRTRLGIKSSFVMVSLTAVMMTALTGNAGATFSYEITSSKAEIPTPKNGQVFTLPPGKDTVDVPVEGKITYVIKITNKTNQLQFSSAFVDVNIDVDGNKMATTPSHDTQQVQAMSSVTVTVTGDQLVTASVKLGTHLATVSGDIRFENEDPGEISTTSQFSVVPEPSCLVLTTIGTAVLGLSLARRSRRRPRCR